MQSRDFSNTVGQMLASYDDVVEILEISVTVVAVSIDVFWRADTDEKRICTAILAGIFWF